MDFLLLNLKYLSQKSAKFHFRPSTNLNNQFLVFFYFQPFSFQAGASSSEVSPVRQVEFADENEQIEVEGEGQLPYDGLASLETFKMLIICYFFNENSLQDSYAQKSNSKIFKSKPLAV